MERGDREEAAELNSHRPDQYNVHLATILPFKFMNYYWSEKNTKQPDTKSPDTGYIYMHAIPLF